MPGFRIEATPCPLCKDCGWVPEEDGYLSCGRCNPKGRDKPFDHFKIMAAHKFVPAIELSDYEDDWGYRDPLNGGGERPIG